MKILFFTRLFYPHIGGVEKHVLEVSKRLIKKGYRVTIVTEELSTEDIPIYLQSKKRLPKHETIDTIEIYRITIGKNDWFKKFRIWKELWKLRRLIKSADVVHCHDVFFWYLPFRFLFFNKPAYTTFHGYESYPLKSNYILMHKLAEKLSKGNICIGEFMRKWYGTKANYISYGGVTLEKSDKRKATNDNSAIFVGRLDEQTGIKTYVNAVKLIREKIPDFRFEIIGDGKFRKKIEKNFRVLGFKKNPENYLKDYRFVFVSRYLSILEAMAVKKLVFAVYDNLLKKDYLLMTPFAKFIVIVRSEKELAEKIFYFLNNPGKEKQMIDDAFSWVNNQGWGKITEEYEKLWSAF